MSSQEAFFNIRKGPGWEGHAGGGERAQWHPRVKSCISSSAAGSAGLSSLSCCRDSKCIFVCTTQQLLLFLKDEREAAVSAQEAAGERALETRGSPRVFPGTGQQPSHVLEHVRGERVGPVPGACGIGCSWRWLTWYRVIGRISILYHSPEDQWGMCGVLTCMGSWLRPQQEDAELETEPAALALT